MGASSFPGVTVVNHPLIHVRLTTLRDRATPPDRFRAALADLAAVLLFEATRDLALDPHPIETPLAPFEGSRLARPLVVVPILRAGLGMADAILRLLPEASVGHIGMARDEETFRPASYYCRQPSGLAEADVLLVDPMLATGHSACEAVATLKARGARAIRFLCVVSCPEGLRELLAHHPDVPVYTAAVDDGLNERAYILPGLGDAGDRYFGTL
jgi:uracil phosphoribosyltransferase